jgi:transposase
MEPALRRGGRHLLEDLLQARHGRRPRAEIVAFLKNLRRHLAGRKLLIIWDRLQARRSRLVRDYVESEGGGIKLAFLPPYAPELNPVEYLWAHWTQHEMPNFCPKDVAELSAFARAKLKRTQRRKTLVAAFWKQAEPACP